MRGKSIALNSTYFLIIVLQDLVLMGIATKILYFGTKLTKKQPIQYTTINWIKDKFTLKIYCEINPRCNNPVQTRVEM